MPENAMMYRHLTIRDGKLVVVHKGPMKMNKDHPDYAKYYGKRARKSPKTSKRRKAA